MKRSLSQDLESYFDARINAEVQDPTHLMLEAAKSLVGITAKDEDIINLIRSTVAVPNGESWCMDFVQSCIAYAEAKTGAISPLAATELCLGLWAQSRSSRMTLFPKEGDIIIWEFGGTIHGHTGFLLGEDTLRWKTVEGNTSGADKIDPNGNGVWLKNRAKGGSATFRELGFLRPFGDLTVV